MLFVGAKGTSLALTFSSIIKTPYLNINKVGLKDMREDGGTMLEKIEKNNKSISKLYKK